MGPDWGLRSHLCSVPATGSGTNSFRSCRDSIAVGIRAPAFLDLTFSMERQGSLWH